MLKILLPKLSNSHNQQLLSKDTKSQTSSFSFFFCLKLILYNSNPWIKCVTESKILIFLVCKNLNSSFFAWLTHLILEVSLHSWLLWPTVWHSLLPSSRSRSAHFDFFFLSRLWFSPTWAEYYQHWKKSLEWGLNIQPMLCLAMNWVNFCWSFLCHVLPR